MSDVLSLALNTTKQLSIIDQTHVLGGRISNASAQFLNVTSHAVASILKTHLNAIHAMVVTTNGIANGILQNASRFVARTGQILSRIIGSSIIPAVVPHSISTVTEGLRKSSVNLVHLTDRSLANVINATAAILTNSISDNNEFVTKILNTTAHLVHSTTDSLEHLLNTTNHLIAAVIESRVNASATLLNDTSNLLKASSQAINSFLNATTLVISNSPHDRLTRDGSSASVTALQSAETTLSKIFNRISDLLHGVLNAEKDIKFRLINATDELLNANFHIKATLSNAIADFSSNATNSAVNFVSTPNAAPNNPAIITANNVENSSGVAEKANSLEKAPATDGQKLNAPKLD